MGLRQHHQPLGSGLRVGAAEHRDAPLAHAVELAHRFLELLRIDVAAGANDHVLGAAGDEELAAGQIAEVSRVEPVAVEEPLGRLAIAKIAAGRRRTAELDPPLLALTDLGAGGVDDPDLVLGQRKAGADETQGVGSSSAAGSARPAPVNAARATESTTGPRPTGGKASAREHSARP